MSNHHPALDELLVAESRETRTWRRLPIELHLSQCATCRETLRVHQMVLGRIAREQAADAGDMARSIARVRRRLTSETAPADTRPSGWAWLGATAAIVTVLMSLGIFSGGRSQTDALPAGTLPLPHFTPGATVEVSLEDLCAGRLPPAPAIGHHVREEVVQKYRMAHLPAEHYELDYLITPELGGAPVAENLWPEPYEGLRWNALVKDHLERLLPRLVCKGELDLATAQRDIARDWVAAYRKYFGTPTPLREYAALWPERDLFVRASFQR